MVYDIVLPTWHCLTHMTLSYPFFGFLGPGFKNRQSKSLIGYSPWYISFHSLRGSKFDNIYVHTYIYIYVHIYIYIYMYIYTYPTARHIPQRSHKYPIIAGQLLLFGSLFCTARFNPWKTSWLNFRRRRWGCDYSGIFCGDKDANLWFKYQGEIS